GFALPPEPPSSCSQTQVAYTWRAWSLRTGDPVHRRRTAHARGAQSAAHSPSEVAASSSHRTTQKRLVSPLPACVPRARGPRSKPRGPLRLKLVFLTVMSRRSRFSAHENELRCRGGVALNVNRPSDGGHMTLSTPAHYDHTEGAVARTIEEQTAKLP